MGTSSFSAAGSFGFGLPSSSSRSSSSTSSPPASGKFFGPSLSGGSFQYTSLPSASQRSRLYSANWTGRERTLPGGSATAESSASASVGVKWRAHQRATQTTRWGLSIPPGAVSS